MPCRPRAAILPVLLALAAGLAACGGSDAPSAATDVPPLTAGTPAPATAATPTTGATTPTTATAPTTATTTPQTTATQPATTTSPTGATGGAPAGCPAALGGFIRDVRARGTDCGRAQTVAKAWFDAVHGGAAPDTQIVADGATCTGSLAGERASVSCATGGGAAISFTASP